MNHPESVSTLVTLANANELVCAIVQGVVGNELADSVNGSPLTRSIIFNLTQAEIQAAQSKVLG